jgi:hypothetical protein
MEIRISVLLRRQFFREFCGICAEVDRLDYRVFGWRVTQIKPDEEPARTGSAYDGQRWNPCLPDESFQSRLMTAGGARPSSPPRRLLDGLSCNFKRTSKLYFDAVFLGSVPATASLPLTPRR